MRCRERTLTLRLFLQISPDDESSCTSRPLNFHISSPALERERGEGSKRESARNKQLLGVGGEIDLGADFEQCEHKCHAQFKALCCAAFSERNDISVCSNVSGVNKLTRQSDLEY